MALGDKGPALVLSKQAMAVVPVEKDALDGPSSIEILARVSAQMGEPDRAIAALQKLLSIPYEAHWLSACRSLPLCSGSIQCSTRSGMIRASKSSPGQPRRNNSSRSDRVKRRSSLRSLMFFSFAIVGYSKLVTNE